MITTLPTTRSGEDAPLLLRALDSLRAPPDEIAARVERRRADLAARTGVVGRDLEDLLARELIWLAGEKSAVIATGAALPLSIPLLGPIASTLLVVPAGALWVTLNEIELCYALSYAYGLTVPEEQLRLVSYWLVRLSNYDDLQSKALRMGVTLTVRKLIQKLIAIGLTRALATTSTRMMVRMMGPQATPWYVRATAYLGVPVLATLAWRNTLGVGKRAVEYFAADRPPLALPAA